MLEPANAAFVNGAVATIRWLFYVTMACAAIYIAYHLLLLGGWLLWRAVKRTWDEIILPILWGQILWPVLDSVTYPIRRAFDGLVWALRRFSK